MINLRYIYVRKFDTSDEVRGETMAGMLKITSITSPVI